MDLFIRVVVGVGVYTLRALPSTAFGMEGVLMIQ